MQNTTGYDPARRCIACGGSGHSYLTCVLLGAALHRKLDTRKDMTDVLDVILRLLLWDWKERREASVDEEITCLSYAPSCDVIAVGSRAGICFINAQTGEKIWSPVCCDSAVISIAFKENMIAAGCVNGKIKLFAPQQSGYWGEIHSQSPMRGHRYAPSLSEKYFLTCFKY